MLRVQFLKRNNGSTEVNLTARDLEGSVFKRLVNEYNELPFLGPMTLNQTYALEQAINLQ
jgi:hypothetical protein